MVKARQDLEEKLASIQQTTLEQRQRIQTKEEEFKCARDQVSAKLKAEEEKRRAELVQMQAASEEEAQRRKDEAEERIRQLEVEAARMKAESDVEMRSAKKVTDELVRERQSLEVSLARVKLVMPLNNVLNYTAISSPRPSPQAGLAMRMSTPVRGDVSSASTPPSSYLVRNTTEISEDMSTVERLSARNWSSQNVAEYLQGLEEDFGERASEYSNVMMSEDINGKTLLELNDSDLRELKFTMGHRKLLLSRIALLEDEANFGGQGIFIRTRNA